MDFGFSSEQKMLRNSFKEFFNKECTPDLVRELWDDPRGYSEKIWKKMAKLGWLGLIYDEQYGGSECGFLDLFILFEEMGKSQLPSPLFTSAVLSGLIIDACGNEAQKRSYLKPMISGRSILTLALLNNGGEQDFHSPEIEATIDEKGEHRLNGVRWLVPYANAADAILVCADAIGSESGPTLYCIETKTDGVTCTPLNTLYGENKCVVHFNNVKVTADQIIGDIGNGNYCVEKILPQAVVLKCAEMIGGARHVLDSTVAYVKERHQFGRPLGALQAVQHLCADMNTLYIGARLVAYQAASRIDLHMPADKEVAIAKAWCSDAYKQMTWIAQQLFGGIGFTEEYHLQLYFKHAKECELLFGDSSHHRAKLADAMGL